MASVTDVVPGAPVSASSPEAIGGDTTAKDKNDNWRFLEPQPLREDQVENAVKFLSHPKVKGSPVVYRRSFLEKKGLSREEIDEAFRRVPDPPSDSSSAMVPTTVPQIGAGGAVINHPRQSSQLTGRVGPITGEVAPKSTSWTRMLVALGVLTAAGAGAGVITKKYFIPKIKEWILEIVSPHGRYVEPGKPPKPSPIEEAANAAAAAAAAAAAVATQVAGAMQEIASSRSEDRHRLDSIIRAVEAQTQELKDALAGMRDTVQSAEVTKYQRSVTNNFESNGVATIDYMKAQVNGIRPSSADSRAMNTKPSNFGASDPSSGFYNNRQEVESSFPAPTNGSIHAPHSQSYLDVLAMLQRGEKPPGIREVNDKPPNPNQPPSNPRLQPRPKPWEKAAVETQPIIPPVNADTGQPGRYNESWIVGGSPAVRTELTIGPTAGSSSEPWWRQKLDPQTVLHPSSVRITELDPVTETDIATVAQSEQPGGSSSPWQSGGGRPGWVPPAVPQAVYPGAEEAIKRPKPATGAVSRSFLESGSAYGAPSSSLQDPQLALQSNNIQPDERAEVPDEQQPDSLGTSLVEPTPFKDVEQEGDQQL